MPADDRPQLKAIAAGTLTRSKDADVLSVALFEKHASAFQAWAVFSDNRGLEPLAAPTGLLTPLP